MPPSSPSPTDAPAPRVVVYVLGHECPLCDDAVAHLEALRAARPLDLRVVAIESDPRLALRHALRAPVVEVDGREVAFGRTTRAALEAAVFPPKVAGRR